MNRPNDSPSSIPLDCSCDDALASIQRSLDRRGLRALQTFDLHDARLREAGCACPYHGTSTCDCQMLVLMVYGEAAAPTTLMLHGHVGQTWLSLVEDSARPADRLIVRAIEEAVQYIQGQQGL